MADERKSARAPGQLETPRLVLRPFVVEDADAAFGWFGDPEVMRFIPTGPDRSVEQTRERISRYCAHQARHGFSKWIARLRSSGEAVGDSGLLVLDSGVVDLGFRLARAHWGRGLATEIAQEWVRAAFADFSLSRLTAFSHSDNGASVRVLEKAGFRRTGRSRVMGIEAFTYVLDGGEVPSSGALAGGTGPR